jgi:hypothetical protein
MSEAQWQQIREETRAAEATTGLATNLHARSQEERARLRANTIELSIEELDNFVGTYLSADKRYQVAIKRVNNHLLFDDRLDLFALEPRRFAYPRVKLDLEFSVTNGRVTGFIIEEGQFQSTLIRTEDAEP